ncbi:MAG: L-serine ammonia-lyase, iron-sulfur-dependent subunit beta [Lachnospiraceae bacterium]|jgi:L-serine dehydratase|nr:L-serine ammonia-lyase, iron-sulfur-dependent subunit beta [Lachnospiraceae bacterium]
MHVLDIIGPVMVGPSSSHTAGAARIGYAARKLLGEDVAEVEVLLYGSFLATGRGHGTDRAIVAGLLGLRPDDGRIPHSLELAAEKNMKVTFGEAQLKNAHPNSVLLKMLGVNGAQLEVLAASVGGGVIEIREIDGLATVFSGEYPTLIVQNEDQAGHVAVVTSMLSSQNVNIADMRLYRDSRGGRAVMVIECDSEVPAYGLEWIKRQPGVLKVIYYSLL